MNYKKFFGYGILIWAIPYILAMAFFAYGVLTSIWAILTLLVVTAFLVYYLGTKLSANTPAEALKYSAGWVVIAVILDMLFTVPYSGWELFS